MTKKENFKYIIFWVLIFFFLISFLLTMFLNRNKFFIPMFGSINSELTINVEMPENMAGNLHIYADGKELPAGIIYKDNPFYAYRAKSSDIKYLYFKTDNDEVLNSIETIISVIGRNFYYYTNSDIKKFNKTSDGYYIFPYDMKFDKKSNTYTDMGIYHKFFTCFLSVFYETNYYIISLIFLVLAILTYINIKSKPSFNFNFLKNKAIWIIIFLGAIFRLQNNDFAFWQDELFTLGIIARPNTSLLYTFNDPGNPPLFYLLAKIWTFFTGAEESSARLLSAVFSIFTIPLIYSFVKRNLDINAGIFAAFLFCISIVSIHSAQEFRCYSLCIFLGLFSSYFLFEIIKYNKNKDFIIYAIIASLMANTHYYQIFILFANFIWAMFMMNDNKQKLKFFCSNLIAALAFCPHFLLTGLYGGLIDETFNDILKNRGLEDFYDLIRFFEHPVIFVIISALILLFLIPKTRNLVLKHEAHNHLLLLFYSFYLFCAASGFAFLFSYSVRPIIKLWYFANFYWTIPIIITSIVYMPFKNRIIKFIVSSVFVFTTLFHIQGGDNNYLFNLKNWYLSLKLESIYQFAHYDFIKEKNKKRGIAIFAYSPQFNYTFYYKKWLKGDETLISYFLDKNLEYFHNACKQYDLDTIYSIILSESFFDLIKDTKAKYNLSFVVANDEAILVKMTKKEI